jgi:hypothetical protein
MVYHYPDLMLAALMEWLLKLPEPRLALDLDDQLMLLWPNSGGTCLEGHGSQTCTKSMQLFRHLTNHHLGETHKSGHFSLNSLHTENKNICGF